MRFSPPLPPLVILLLLAFLWLVLLVLLLWFTFRPRRGMEGPDNGGKKTRSKAAQEGLEATLKAAPPTRSAPPPRTTVRVVSPTERDAEANPHDDFDEFNRPGNRRDDFDF